MVATWCPAPKAPVRRRNHSAVQGVVVVSLCLALLACLCSSSFVNSFRPATREVAGLRTTMQDRGGGHQHGGSYNSLEQDEIKWRRLKAAKPLRYTTFPEPKIYGVRYGLNSLRNRDTREPPGGEAKSVFDGDVSAANSFRSKFRGKYYKVNRDDWTYETIIKNEDGTETKETGAWSRAWTMPEEAFQSKRGHYWKRFNKLCRKKRRKHNGHKHPNGKYVHLVKMQGSPFCAERYGPQYAERIPFFGKAKTDDRYQQRARAKELHLMYETAAEEKRLSRLKALGIWPGTRDQAMYDALPTVLGSAYDKDAQDKLKAEAEEEEDEE
eukprot:TRINITY_DN81453_c0_g1_i1.p1 TRINITY_DN81453_c0_g1~~TRINITY_DN81453_c0_g1_i1.p1  ORF type:complete len:325 (-),score=42.23 TRINITY_DN81453_c0_g1_i1:144-1118(-)